MLALGGAVAAIAVYVAIALVRVRYPFELEWMEGSIVDHVRRIAAGDRIYVRPSLEFVPFLYPPLYYYVSAAVAAITGVSLFPLRLVSLGSSLAAFGAIFALVRRETGSRAVGLLSAGLFAATFRATGAWFDTARVDSLFLALLLGSIYLVRFGESGRACIAAGVLAALSALTKQTALVIAPALVVYLLLVSRRRAIWFASGLAVTFGVLSLVLEAANRGWYFFYVFRLPSRIQNVENVTIRFWTVDILGSMAVAAALAAGYAIVALGRLSDRRNWFYPLVGATLLVASWTTRAHLGAFDNVLMPAYAGLSIIAGVALHDVMQALADRRAVYAYVAYIAQLGVLTYNPQAQLPTQVDRDLGQQLVARLADAKGEVFVPRHSWLTTMAGKRSLAHSQAIVDVINGADDETRGRLEFEIRSAIRAHRFQMVVADRLEFWFGPWLQAEYRFVGPAFPEDGFWPLTGMATRPESIYVPR
jgi:dolichyl-phosphate-mannose-protein mannosyltransferase